MVCRAVAAGVEGMEHAAVAVAVVVAVGNTEASPHLEVSPGHRLPL